MQDEIDRDLQRARKLDEKDRPLYDYFNDRSLIELGEFRVLIETPLPKLIKMKKRKLVK
jgi:hypothetical protein